MRLKPLLNLLTLLILCFLTLTLCISTVFLYQYISEDFQSRLLNNREVKGLYTNNTARVERVIDGDTIKLVDGRTVRYIGIDTPESVDPSQPVECFGKEAAEKNRVLVEGKKVTLEKDVSEKDRFGRILRYVYVKEENGNDIFVNKYLVEQGYASASSFPPDVKYQETFREEMRKAVLENKGLWGSCKY